MKRGLKEKMAANNLLAGLRVNRDRLAGFFMDLVQIDSPSRHEGRLAGFIKEWFAHNAPEAQILEDDSALATGSETGNIVIKVPGRRDCSPIFFNAHMDTVEPGRGIKPRLVDGVFRSDGTTILGGDDKAAIAILMEVISLISEHDLALGPFEIILTTCEEIGLLGAKALDTSLVESEAGYALDSEDMDSVINRAPAAIRFRVKVHGVAAHAGLNPEDGISAIKVAAAGIANAPQGRIDPDTTCNIGLIKGGSATNIVPELVVVEGEVRSHNKDTLRRVQDEMLSCFYRASEDFKREDSGEYPFVTTVVEDDYPLMDVDPDHPAVSSVLKAASSLGRKLNLVKTGGGSDANIFNQKGLTTLILGIGMQKVHTTEEFIRLSDMEETCRLTLSILNEWAG